MGFGEIRMNCKSCGVNPRWGKNSPYEKTKFCEKCNIDMYRQHLDELSIEDVHLTTSIALEKCDPIGYGIGFIEFVESEELEDERNGKVE